MKQVELVTTLDVTADKLWEEFSYIENYPKYVKFMSKCEVLGPFRVGTVWVDTTTILFFPQKIRHKIAELEENKKICFEVKLPLGGEMTQSFLLAENKGVTKVTAKVTFDLKNFVLSFLLDSFLKRRLEDMLQATLINFKERFNLIK